MYLIKCLSELNDLADVIIIDTGAGISDQVLEFVIASPEVLLVTTPDPSSLTDAYSLLKALYRNPNFSSRGASLKVIANKCVSADEGVAVYEKLNSVVSQFLNGSLEYVGMIPQDSVLERAVRAQKTVSLYDPRSKSARAYEQIANQLLNGENGEAQVKWGFSQMLTNLFTRH